MGTYLYRCTEQQLEEHLTQIAEAGDTVEHVIYKGGRDYVLVVKKAAEAIIVRLDEKQVANLNAHLARLEKSIENGAVRGANKRAVR